MKLFLLYYCKKITEKKNEKVIKSLSQYEREHKGLFYATLIIIIRRVPKIDASQLKHANLECVQLNSI